MTVDHASLEGGSSGSGVPGWREANRGREGQREKGTETAKVDLVCQIYRTPRADESCDTSLAQTRSC